MSAGILDLVAAWRARGRVIACPTPDGEPLEPSTLSALARARARQIMVTISSSEGEEIGQLAFSPELARNWAHYFLVFASKCAAEDERKKRVAEGKCGSLLCKRKLVGGTERCRKCGEQIAARARAEGSPR